MRPAKNSPNHKARIIASALLAALFFLVQQADAYDPTKFPGRGSKQAWQAAGPVNNAGSKLIKQGKYKEALETYKSAIAIYPFDAGTFSNAGAACKGLKQYTNAVQYYQHAIELAPDFAAAYFNMGNSYWKLRNFSEAERMYRKSISLSPKLIDPKINLGELYLDMKRPADAKKVLLEALALPDSKLAENKTMIDDDLKRTNTALRADSTLKSGE